MLAMSLKLDEKNRTYRCGECGSKNIAARNARDHSWGMPWKNYPWVPLQVDLNIPMCIDCGNTVIPGELIDSVDAALQRSIRQTTRDHLDQISQQYMLSYNE